MHFALLIVWRQDSFHAVVRKIVFRDPIGGLLERSWAVWGAILRAWEAKIELFARDSCKKLRTTLFELISSKSVVSQLFARVPSEKLNFGFLRGHFGHLGGHCGLPEGVPDGHFGIPKTTKKKDPNKKPTRGGAQRLWGGHLGPKIDQNRPPKTSKNRCDFQEGKNRSWRSSWAVLGRSWGPKGCRLGGSGWQK